MPNLNSKEILTAQSFIVEFNGIITLCGSTKFFNEYMEANRRLTFNGWIVLACGSYGHSFHKYHITEAAVTPEQYAKVKKLHFTKIAMSDAIVVVHDGSEYIGDSTRAEIVFAEQLKIPVITFNGREFQGEIVPANINWTSDLRHANHVVNNFSKKHSLGF